MTELIEKVKKTMAQHRMCEAGERIAVGVSGGADSVALLDILWHLAKEEGFFLTAVHVEHGLRGEESKQDRRFTEDFCQKRGIDCRVYAYDVKQEAAKMGIGLEEAGRKLRYAALRKEAAGGKIAVAHHSMDQAETVLMHLLRGAGTEGLCGMAYRNEDVIRPLLDCTKEEILEYCKENGISWRQDASNFETDYTRNKIRLQVFPLLEEIYPKATEHIVQAAEILRQEHEMLNDMAKEAAEEIISHQQNDILLHREKLLRLKQPLRRRVLSLAYLAATGSKTDLSRRHLLDMEQMLSKEAGKQLDLPGQMVLTTEYDKLRLQKRRKTDAFCYELPLDASVWVAELEVWITVSSFCQKREKNSCRAVFDYDRIGKNPLICRSRKAGDRIQLPFGTKKLKDYWIDEKIPRAKRERTPLIFCGEELLWIAGRRASSAFLADEKTKHFVTIEIQEERKT